MNASESMCDECHCELGELVLISNSYIFCNSECLRMFLSEDSDEESWVGKCDWSSNQKNVLGE